MRPWLCPSRNAVVMGANALLVVLAPNSSTVFHTHGRLLEMLCNDGELDETGLRHAVLTLRRQGRSLSNNLCGKLYRLESCLKCLGHYNSMQARDLIQHLTSELKGLPAAVVNSSASSVGSS